MAKKPANKVKKLADGGETKKGFYSDANAQLAQGAMSGLSAVGGAVKNEFQRASDSMPAPAPRNNNLDFSMNNATAGSIAPEWSGLINGIRSMFSRPEGTAGERHQAAVAADYAASGVPATPQAAAPAALPTPQAAPQAAAPQAPQAALPPRSPYLDEQAPYGRAGDPQPQKPRMMGEVDAMLQKMRDMGASQDNIDTMTRRLGKYMMGVSENAYGYENKLANTALGNQGNLDVAHAKGGYGILDRRMANQGALDLDLQKGTREDSLKRSLAETHADTAKYEALARTYPQMAPYLNKPNDPRAAMYLQRLFERPKKEEKASGGVVGFAAGGAVPPSLDPGMEGMETMPGQFSLPSAQENMAVVNKWKAYAQAALSNHVMPVDLITFQQMASPMQKSMAAGRSGLGVGPGATPMMGMASGGKVPVPVAGREVVDPSHGGAVDSIPAVIDGQQEAALNSGEVVIPADVVRALGTEYFDKLIAKYHKTKQPTAVG